MRLVLLLGVLLAAPLHAERPGAQLRAGAAVVDVTPDRLPAAINCGFQERTTNTVTDRLHARALALDDGTTRLAIVIVDSCMMPRELIDSVKKLAHESTRIPIENLLIAATHTHSAPAAMGCLGSDVDAAYPEFLRTRLVRAIEQAHQNLAPARVGWAVAQAPDHTHNRRWILRPDKVRNDPFGQATVRANMHPGYLHPDFVGPSGPVDPALTLLAVQTPEGTPVAVLANYSMHYFGTAPVSADYFGHFAAQLARRIVANPMGARPVVMMSQGTSGDLMWMDYGQPQVKRSVEDYAGALADIAHNAYQKIEYRPTADLAMREARLTLARRTPDEPRLQWARELVTRLDGRKPTTQPDIYAREAVFLHDEPKRELKLQAIRIGGFALAAIPNEVFALTGLRIKASSPLDPTAVIELANGAEGYIPPPAQHTLGGYTTWPARTAGLEVQAEPKIAETVIELLEAVSGKKRRPPTVAIDAAVAAVVARKPVAFWRLDEMHGSRAVDATGKNDATYEERIAQYLDGARPTSRCAHFAGGRVRATVPALTDRYSVEMWIWNGLPANARPVTGYFFSRGADGEKGAPGDHLGIGGTHSHTGKLIFFTGNDRNQVLGGKTVLEARAWHRVVLVRDGKKVTVYLNGKPEIESEADVTVPAEGSALFVGGRSDGYAGFAGKIDDVAVYNRTLTADEAK